MANKKSTNIIEDAENFAKNGKSLMSNFMGILEEQKANMSEKQREEFDKKMNSVDFNNQLKNINKEIDSGIDKLKEAINKF